MNRVPLSEFNAHSSRYLADFGDDDLVLTKHGKAVARLSAANDEGDLWNFLGALEGKVYVDPDDDLLSACSTSKAHPQPRLSEARR